MSAVGETSYFEHVSLTYLHLVICFKRENYDRKINVKHTHNHYLYTPCSNRSNIRYIMQVSKFLPQDLTILADTFSKSLPPTTFFSVDKS